MMTGRSPFQAWKLHITAPKSENLLDTDGKNIVIFTAQRSGSSFTGQLFRQNPDIMYLSEPLTLLQINRTNSIHTQRSAIIQTKLASSLPELFSCNFEPLHRFATANGQKQTPHERKNVQLWHMYIFRPLYEIIGITSFRNVFSVSMQRLSSLCKMYKHRAAKVVKGRYLSSAWDLVEPPTGININNRILYLVLDPRGLLASTHKIESKHNPQLQKEVNYTAFKGYFIDRAREICKEYLENLRFLQSTNSSNMVGVIRYESLAHNPVSMAAKIYQFLNILPLPTQVVDWIHRSTTNASKEDRLHPFNLHRNSSTTAEAWREYIPFELTKEIDTQCLEAMDLLGYNVVSDLSQYNNGSISYVGDLKVKNGLF